jgi:hypothetical protein
MYRRGVGNAFTVPPPKKGKFQLHLLVVGDGQHLWMVNVALVDLVTAGIDGSPAPNGLY